MSIIYLVLNWFFGGLFLILALSSLLKDPIPSIPLFTMSVLLLPPIRKLFYEKTNIAISAKVRGILIFILFLTFGSLAADSQAKKEQLIAQQQAKEQAEKREAIKKENINFFVANKTSIMAEIQSEYDSGKYQQAISKAQKYLVSNDAQLIELHKLAKNKFVEAQKEEKTKQLLAQLKSIPSSEFEKNKNLYQQLLSLNPDDESYKSKYELYSRKLAKAKENQRLADERKKLIESQFSAWDNSHHNLEKVIKSSMNDPKSYEHVETVYWDMKTHLVVLTTFRGKNAFGGLVKNSVKAKVGLDGNVIKIMEQF